MRKHCANAVDVPDVDDANAAQLHIVADDLRRGTDQHVFTDELDLHRVVGNQTVTALNEFEGCLALADAAVAHQKDAFPVDVDQDAVSGKPGSEIIMEQEDHSGLKIGCVGRGIENVAVVLLRHFEAFRERLTLVADDERGNVIGHEAVKGLQPFLVVERVEIGRLNHTDHLHAFGIEVVVESGQLHRGPVDVGHGQNSGFVVFGEMERLKIHILHDGFKGDGILARHEKTSCLRVMILLFSLL